MPSAPLRSTVLRTQLFISWLTRRSPIPARTAAVVSNQPRTTLERLHARVTQTYNPDLTAFMDRSVIVATISSNGILPKIAASIAHQILEHNGSIDAHITGLRVSRVVPFTSDDRFWAVLEWRTGNDIDVLALFQIENDDDSNSVLNCLMHHGYGGRRTASSGRVWSRTSISWTVASVGNLKSLFGAARHLLGILEIPVSDCFTLYFENEQQNHSEEESEPDPCPY